MTPYELAQKYYPRLWDLDRLKALLAAGKLTQKEFDTLVGTPVADSGKQEVTN